MHRDIKPANILLDNEGKTHIADFGLAKLDDQFFKNDAGRVLGTVAYMSPEQAAGQSHWATPQTDIYSLGVMLYQMLTKKLPFSSVGTATDVLEQIKLRIPPPPRTVDEKIPKQLEEVCLKAMAKSPADRYRTAGDMAADLRKAIAGAPPKSRTPMVAIAGAAAAALIFLAIWAPWRSHKDIPQNRPDTARGVFVIPPDVEFTKLNLPPGTPTVEAYYQAATENGIHHRLRYSPIVVHEGDKVRFVVSTAENEPRYLYLYWYDANGKPQRLWPDEKSDLDHQQKLSRLSVPNDKDDFWGLDASQGAETVLVFAREKPMSRSELDEFEHQTPYHAGEVQLDKIYAFSSAGLSEERGRDEHSRGLTTIVKSRSNPLAPKFEQTLAANSAEYDGLVIPHH